MPATTASGHVQEVLSSNLALSASREYGYFSLLEAPDTMIEPEMLEKFRTSFAFDEKEKLLGCKSYPHSILNATLIVCGRFSWLYLPTAPSLWQTVHFVELFLVPFLRSTDFENDGQ